MAKHAPEELKAAIRRYHRDGWSCYTLSKMVPYSRTAIVKWCDSEQRENQKKNSRDWIRKNKKQHQESCSRWNDLNKEHVSEYGAAYRDLNKAKIREAQREYHAKHREKRNAASAVYRKANKEKMRQLDRDWVRNNPDKNAAKTAKIRAGEACPPWITEDQKLEMLRFYTEAHLMTQETGIQYEVDHIHPLKSRKIEACGLHVPWNLQILTSSENKQKSDSTKGV